MPSKNYKYTKILVFLLLLIFIPQIAAAESASAETEGTTESFRRYTPSGQYGGSSSFFFLHGYITVNYAQAESNLGNEINSTPQILVNGISPRTGNNESGFQQDAAIFIGSQPTEDLKGVVELHFVRDATDPVLTEAKLEWEPLHFKDRFNLRFVGGRYWWPFGIHNREWFSAENAFNLVSLAAAEVVPAHVNEVGLMLESEILFKENLGLNALISIGNGPNSFELGDNVRNTPFDFNDNRTLTTRVELTPNIKNLRIGGSASFGDLREGTDTTNFAAGDPRQLPAEFVAYGPHLTYYHDRGLEWRAYWYWSEENIQGANDIKRHGGTLTALYNIKTDVKYPSRITPKVRYSQATEDRLNATDFTRRQIGLGVNLNFTQYLLGKVEYVFQIEDDTQEIDNDVFNISFTLSY